MSIECARCGASNGPGEVRCYRCNAHLPVTLTVGKAESSPQVPVAVPRSRRHRNDGPSVDYKPGKGGATLTHDPSDVPFEDVPFDIDDSGDIFTSAEARYAPGPRSSRRLVYGAGRIVDESGADPADLISGKVEPRPAEDRSQDAKRKAQKLVEAPQRVDEARPSPARAPAARPDQDATNPTRRKLGASPPVMGPVTYVPGKGIVPRVPAGDDDETSIAVKAVDDELENEPTLVGAKPKQGPPKKPPIPGVAELGATFEMDSPPAKVAPHDATRMDVAAVSPVTAMLEILDPFGAPRKSVELPAGRTIIGREHGDIVLTADPTVAPWHAELILGDKGVTVQDMGTSNGVYVRVRSKTVLVEGDSITCGGQRFMFSKRWEAVPETHDRCVPLGARGYTDAARLILFREGGQVAGIYFVGDAVIVGRSRGDVIFADDETMSPEHFAVRRSGSEFVLMDLDSDLGVYRRIDGPQRLEPGDTIQVGRTRLRVTY